MPFQAKASLASFCPLSLEGQLGGEEAERAQELPLTYRCGGGEELSQPDVPLRPLPCFQACQVLFTERFWGEQVPRSLSLSWHRLCCFWPLTLPLCSNLGEVCHCECPGGHTELAEMEVPEGWHGGVMPWWRSLGPLLACFKGGLAEGTS